MQFYKKNDKGEYSEVLDEEFGQIFGERIERVKAQETEKIKTKLGEKYREEVKEQYIPELTKTLTETLTKDITTKIQEEYKAKAKEADDKIKTLDTQIRQKTIAAEYGFKAELESFLGSGDDEDMRKKADILKQSNTSIVNPPTKESGSSATSGFVTKVS